MHVNLCITKLARGVFATVIVMVAGCGVSMKSSMPAPEIPVVSRGMINTGASRPRVALEGLKDNRMSLVLAEGDGKQSTSSTDVGLKVQDALQRTLQNSGFEISDSAAIVVTGEVRKWNARVQGGLPGSVRSEASIYLEVLDPSNKKLYSGEYEGTASVEEPGINESDIQKNLGTAMSEALNQVVADRRLAQILASF